MNNPSFKAAALPRRALLAAAALPLLPTPALAQGAWPDRPIRLLVGFSAGGPTDVVARVAAQGMSEVLGQPVTVENRTGAAGNIASEAAARAPADGNTIIMVNVGQIVINPHTYERMAVDPMRDLAPVSLATITGLVLAIHPSLGSGDHTELVARLRREPDRHKFATSGAGGISHVVQELWRQRVEVRMEPVHFRGASAMTPEMLAGRMLIGLDTTQQFDQHIRTGALRAVVNLGGQPSRLQPGIPLGAQVGLTDFAFDNWFGLFAPRATPPAIVARLNQALRHALSLPAALERMASIDMLASPGTPEALAARCEREFRLYGEAIRRAQIRAEA